MSEHILRCASLSNTTGSMMITKHDDKNLKYHRWILQLGNVQKKPYPLAQTNEQRESGKTNYFTKRTVILFLLARTFQQPDTLNQR